MATKKITKIISSENGDNYVADIEDIENRITQNSSNLETAKQELSNKCNETLSQAKAYTDQEKAKLFNSTNGTFTGKEYFRDVNNSVLRFNGGNSHDGGASLMLYGKNENGARGHFDLVASTKEDASDAKQLVGRPDGSLTWAGKNIVRSVNGALADDNGNINIHSIPNYSAGISININENDTHYTCPADGIIFVWAAGISYDASFSCYIGDQRLLFWDISGSETGVFSGIIICGKGEACTFDMIKISQINATFYPFK